MTTKIDDPFQSMNVRLDGKNYSYLSYVIRNFLSGTLMKPRNNDEGYATLIDVWEANNAKIITWINNSIEHFIGTQLATYEITNEV